MDGLSMKDISWCSYDFVVDLSDNCAVVYNSGDNDSDGGDGGDGGGGGGEDGGDDDNCGDKVINVEKVMNFDLNEFSNKTPRPSKALVDITQYKELLDIKEKIESCNQWDKWSKLVHPHDRVQYIAENKNPGDYYKFFELFKYFNIADINTDCGQVSSAHIGNSAKVSIDALAYFVPGVNWHLSVDDTTLNGLKRKVRSHTDLGDCSWMDEGKSDGNVVHFNNDLSYAENLEHFKEKVGCVDIVVCDSSSSDSQHDPNSLEQLSFYNMFCQAVVAMDMLTLNGCMYMKIFDTLTRPTCQFLYYLTKFYENVVVIKPRSSRYTNSEKFLVAKNFKGISVQEMGLLNKTIRSWSSNKYFSTLGIEIPKEIKSKLLNYNNKLMTTQYTYIKKAVKYSQNNEFMLDKQIEAYQNKIAHMFCSNFGIAVNLMDHDISCCKHTTKKKIKIGNLVNGAVCEKCLRFIFSRTQEPTKQ